MSETVAAVALDRIVIGDRARKDVGDLTELCESMESVGLLHPIVLTDGYELVAGGRRLEAARKLKWSGIEARLLPMSAEDMLRAERDENTARLDLRRSEAVALGKKLEAVLKERVKIQRRESGRRLGAGEDPAKTAGSLVGSVRDVVAQKLGMAGDTYQKAKQVVEAGEAEPGQYGDLVEEMDDTGNVYGTHRKLKARQEEAAPPGRTNTPVKVRLKQIAKMASSGHSADQIAARLQVTKQYVQRLAHDNDVKLVEHSIGPSKAIDPNRVVEETVRSLEATAQAIEIIEGSLGELNPEDLEYWSESLAESLKPVKRLARKLKEAANSG